MNSAAKPALAAGAITFLLAFFLAWVSSSFIGFSGWFSYLIILGLGWVLLLLAWRQIQPEEPSRWVFNLTILAILLRLLLGVVWLQALPAWGYPTEVQQAGYIMEDAYNRDQAAWELARSDTPLMAAFQGYSHTDQYGGLLFLSALTYRYLGGASHQPLMTLSLSAVASGLSVLFVWAAAKRLFNEKAAALSAWFLTLYPEAWLLGSSQMREAYTVTLTVAATYTLVRFLEERSRKSLVWIFFLLLLGAFLSLPYLALVGILLLPLFLSILYWKGIAQQNHLLAAVNILFFMIVIAAFIAVNLDLFFDPQYQEYLSQLASGKLQAIYSRIPDWFQVPFLITYGVFRPLLPPALVSTGNLLWQGIAIWRALGWTALLALLFYATYMVIKEKQWLKPTGILLWVNWLVMLVASYRGGGDQWDNPRYRVAFAGVQVILAAWALARQQETRDPWLRRAVALTLSTVFWFMVWYVDRKLYDFGWPLESIPALVGLGLLTGGLYILWDVRAGKRKV